MITVSIGGTEIVVRPKRLIDYVEKIDFIRLRRTTPYDLLRDWPDEDRQTKLGLIEIAMRTVYTNSSSVSFEEELAFDRSEEGLFWTIWKCLPTEPPKKYPKGAKVIEPWREGINRARNLWNSGTPEEKQALRMAIEAVDESNNLKNSESPSELSQHSPPGDEKPPDLSTSSSDR